MDCLLKSPALMDRFDQRPLLGIPKIEKKVLHSN